MNKVRIANIVKKLTELPQEDRKELTNILLKGLENGVPASEFNEVKEDVNALKGKNYVLYDNQELTEEQQMQVRKNLDLYYEEKGIERLVKNIDQEYQIVDYAMSIGARKVSDTPIDANSLIGYKFGYDIQGIDVAEELTITSERIVAGDNYTKILVEPESPDLSVNWAILLIPNDTTINGNVFGKGIWLVDRTFWLEVPTTTIHKIPKKFLSENDAVQYVEQELTDLQKMQARKNQGLYYEGKGKEDKTITFDRYVTPPPSDWKDTAFGTVDTEFLTSSLLVKISDDLPSIDEFKQVNGLSVDNYTVIDGEGYYYIAQGSIPGVVVVLDENVESIPDVGYPRSTGIYVICSIETNRTFNRDNWEFMYYGVDGITYESIATVIHHIEPKYIKDMYYEEEGIGEKRIETSLEDCQAKVYDPDYFRVYTKNNVYHMFFKISEDTPAPTDIISFINGNNETILSSDENFVLNQYDGYFGAGYLGNNFYVASENVNANIDGHTTNLTKGIWVHGLGYGGTLVSDLDCYELVYNGKVSIVHQIPSKYIPSTQTIPAVKIEIPSMGNDVYYNMAQLNVNQYVPSRDVVFSVEGRTVRSILVFDVINGGGGNGYGGNTYTFSSGGLYWVQLELDDDNTFPYVCAMVYVESVI